MKAKRDVAAPATPEVAGTAHIFSGKVIGLRIDTLRDAGGRTYTREIVEYGESIVLVPVDREGRVLMVRQYRHPARGWLLELPAGGVDPSDGSPEAAAQRELREETGQRGRLTRIGSMYLAPGYSEELMHAFAATDLVPDALAPDEDEELLLERVPFGEALRLIDAGELRDAKSIAGLMLYLRHIGQT